MIYKNINEQIKSIKKYVNVIYNPRISNNLSSKHAI